MQRLCLIACAVLLSISHTDRRGATQELVAVPVEGQPLAANVSRLIEALEYLGAPLPAETTSELLPAQRELDAIGIQNLLDEHVLVVVSINPELRVKVERGPAPAKLRQAGYTPFLIKVINDGIAAETLRIDSPQAGPVYAGAAELILERQAQTELLENPNITGEPDRFLAVEIFSEPPMTRRLSGLEVEYVIGLAYSSETGRREATLSFDIGGGTQDIGFRGETPVLFDVAPALPVTLNILDEQGRPTTARIIIRDRLGHVFPPQAKRLAPDFFFQPQIYRHHGESVLLPPGDYEITFSRGPEYIPISKPFTVTTEAQQPRLDLPLERWIDPSEFGFFSGDHHIHGAGCSHYDNPTQGVAPEDMFRQVKGEGLNVGCVLTWGPCFDFQRQYFSPSADLISEPLHLIKYDLEISGFGSAALGHVCLLNLSNQTYPGSQGSKLTGWPSWTVPVMRWAKEQGGFTGYPHSAMHVNPQAAAARMMQRYDVDQSESLSATETESTLLPFPFAELDRDQNGLLSAAELQASHERAADQLPNLAIPEMNGAGAMEIFVAAAEGVCDFTSAMDTARIPEWNTWYHLMNCGLNIKLSGETDFPCMSSRRVGQGRVYVKLGEELDAIDFPTWCAGLAAGRSYVSDGYAHAVEFSVNDHEPGEADLRLTAAETVLINASVAFAEKVPRGVAYGNLQPGAGRRMVGDTINLHAPRSEELVTGGDRTVELVVNGEVVESRQVRADGEIHSLEFDYRVERSCWMAIRQFPQLHTNPVRIIVDGQPIRASVASARWCEESVKLLWEMRHQFIAEDERTMALEAYQRAIAYYQRVQGEAREAE